MLEVILAILFILWIFGFIANVGGGLIHILLLLFLVVLVYRVMIGRNV